MPVAFKSVAQNFAATTDASCFLGNVAVSGTVRPSTLQFIGDNVIGVAITSILDEDDLNSDSAVALATQQSIKKYVDDQNAGQDPGAPASSAQFNNAGVFGGSSGNTMNATVFTKLTTDASADILLESSYDSATAIKLLTDEGTAEQIVITNTQGTNAAAIDINASAGGVAVDAAGALSFQGAAASDLTVSAGGLTITSTGDAATLYCCLRR